MRKIYIAAMLVSLAITTIWADVKMAYFSGVVQVSHNAQWNDASQNMPPLEQSDRVKTGPDSRVMLIVDDSSRVWLGQNTEVEVSSIGEESTFGLLLGKLRAKVKLLTGRHFKVKTPLCVASVRGTEFALSYDGVLEVLEGRVEFADMLEHTVEVAADNVGTLGTDGSVREPRAMTPEERQRLDQEWHEAMGQNEHARRPSGNGEGNFRLRRDIHDMVGDVRSNMARSREMTNEIKESDISAGRTLRDAHGNLVRVEQHILRPDDRSIEFINLTKRPEYRYSDPLGQAGTHGFYYDGPSGSRLDVLDVTMAMNMSLPDQMTDWPSYISGKGDAFHPDTVYAKITNQTDKIEFRGNWRQKGYLDPFNNDQLLGEDGLVFNSFINGWRVDRSYNASGEGLNSDSADQLYAWSVSPDMRLTKDGQERFVKLYTESYVINNGGRILNLNDFTSATDNPFITIKQVAGEYVVFCNDYGPAGTSAPRNFFHRGNLDLIVTPDIALAVAQKLASQIDKIRGGDSSDR